MDPLTPCRDSIYSFNINLNTKAAANSLKQRKHRGERRYNGGRSVSPGARLEMRALEQNVKFNKCKVIQLERKTARLSMI